MPESSDPARQLAAYLHRYRRLAAQLADIGYIADGSVVRRVTRCGKPGCRCQADPPQPHGPYFQWTTKVAGTTVTRRLTEPEAAHYREWITNNRRLRRIVKQMQAITTEAADLITGESATLNVDDSAGG